MLNLRIEDDRVYLTGTGIEFLKIKTLVASRLGAEVVLSEGRNSFSLPIECLSSIIDVLPPVENISVIEQIRNDALLHEQARLKCMGILENEDEGNPLEPWDTILDHLQAVAVHAMIQPNLKGLCLFDEQGSGKTVMAIAAFDLLKRAKEIDRSIIVCPKSMIQEWEKAIGQFIPNKYKIGVIEGDAEEKYKTVLQSNDFCIINYDSVSRLQVPLESVARNAKTLLVIDESFYVKNPDAIRSETIRDIRRSCVRGYVLCGTPAPNSAIDLVNQFDVADDGYTFSGFRPSGDPTSDRPRIEVAMRSRGLFIRRLKMEMFPNLAEKNFKIIQVNLSGRQADLYREAKNNLVLWLRGMDNAAFQKNLVDYFRRRQTLLQLCSCPHAIDPLFFGEHAKLLVLDKLLEEFVDHAQKKVVLWSYYRSSLQELAVRYEHFGLVQVDGLTKAKDRRTAICKFQTDQDTMIFLGNPAAAGAGITLHAASEAIYVSYPSQAAQYLQSLDRIHRRGQTATQVNYHLLVCNQTIEEREVVRLRRKELEQHSLLGDAVPWPSSIDEALAELVGAMH